MFLIKMVCFLVYVRLGLVEVRRRINGKRGVLVVEN